MKLRWWRLAWRYPCRWIEKARRDVRAAELVIGEELYDEAAFHSQQAVEKALKALIVAKGLRAPKTHDIDFLLSILRRTGIEVTWDEKLSNLTRYAVEMRYPGLSADREEALEALETAKRVVEWAKEKLREMGIEC